jgi:hypothetical protein
MKEEFLNQLLTEMGFSSEGRRGYQRKNVIQAAAGETEPFCDVIVCQWHQRGGT